MRGARLGALSGSLMMIVEGYAALFGVADQANDVIWAGAFAASLARRNAPLPLWLEHEPRLQAGFWFDAREDGRGLWLSGEIAEDQPGASRARRMLARGVDGLSIGFIRSSRGAPHGRDLVRSNFWRRPS